MAPLLLVCSAAAERTYIVDGFSRQPFDFPNLHMAAAVADHGDKVIVRSLGDLSYYNGGGTWTKGVTVLCEPGTRFGSQQTHHLEVRDLPAGRTFAWNGGAVPFLATGQVRLFNNRGRVVLSNLSVLGTVYVSACDAVVVNTCTFYGRPGLEVFGRTNVVLTDCNLDGIVPSGVALVGGGGFTNVTLARCWVRGAGATAQRPMDPSQPGISFGNSQVISDLLRICGDAGSRVASGDPPPNQSRAAAIVMNGGRLERDPSIPLTGGRTLNGPATELQGAFPTQTALGAKPGGNLVARIYFPGRWMEMFVALPGDPTPVGDPYTPLWLDPFTMIHIGSSGMATVLNVTLPIPNDPALRGLTVALQSVQFSGFRLSNPAMVVLD